MFWDKKASYGAALVTACSASLLLGGQALSQEIQAGCDFNFSSGSGASLLAWCVSNDGNLLKLESPETKEHIQHSGTEGYVVCSDSGSQHDLGSVESGWGFTTVLSANRNVVKLRRISGDGTWQLDQKFTRDRFERDIKIEMTLLNLSSVPQFNVKLTRTVDLDLESAPSHFFDRSGAAVWAKYLSSGVTLSVIDTALPHTTAITNSPPPTDCDPANPFANEPQFGNLAAHASYLLGTLEPGKSKKVRFIYRAY